MADDHTEIIREIAMYLLINRTLFRKFVRYGFTFFNQRNELNEKIRVFFIFGKRTIIFEFGD